MADPTLSIDNILKIVEIIALISGGGIVAFKVGRSSSQFEAATTRHSEMIAQQNGAIGELREDIKELNKVVASIALFNERMTYVSERLNILDRRYEELRHGEGFTFPLDSHLNKG